MKKSDIMKIKNPNEAFKAIVTSTEFSLDEASELIDDYAAMHNITTEDMAYYPDGRNVVSDLY